MLEAAPAAPPNADAGKPNAKMRIAGFVLGGVGVLGVAAGLGVGGAALAKKGQVGMHCNAQNKCDATGLTLRTDAIGLASASTGVFVAGAALVGAGVVLLIASRPSTPVTTGVTLGPNGVLVQGSF
jgi:hypothetical protein